MVLKVGWVDALVDAQPQGLRHHHEDMGMSQEMGMRRQGGTSNQCRGQACEAEDPRIPA